MPKDFGAICLYALYDIETQRRPNNSRWVQCVEKTTIISCFQRFLHFIWRANFWLLSELDTFASTYSRDLLPHTRSANGFRDRGHLVHSFSARWRQAVALRQPCFSFRAVAARRQVLEKNLKLKSAAARSSREYTASEIFDSGISQIKRQIAFMATLSLYRLGTIFRTRPVLNQCVEPVLRLRTLED